MKLRFAVLITTVFLFCVEGVKSQSIIESSLPLKSTNSIIFGNDIILHNIPSEDQHHVAVCSAFNGWLYAVYTYHNDTYNFGAFTIMKSVDNGNTWTVFIDAYYPMPNSIFKSIDIIAAGDSVSNLKVFLAGVITNNYSIGDGYAFVFRYNGVSGAPEDQILSEVAVYDIAIARDYMFKATNSNPYSIGVLFSVYTLNNDSIIFKSSSNGGISFDNRVGVHSSSNRFHKVCLTYGRSPSWNTGRYFAAWEEKADFNSNVGHIYTAHSEPNFDSPFTTPLMLDSLDSSAYNNSKNPSIACQFNSADNDSTNLTEIVLFDKYLSSQNRYDIDGFYNMKSTNTNHFAQFNLNSLSDSRQQPSINFNPFDQTFMVTYYDSTTQKLPYLLKDFNMQNPNTWQVVSPGYNDSPDLIAPNPKVALNMGEHQGANVWSWNGPGGASVTLFDAPYITDGISGNYTSDNNNFQFYPNPCNTSLTLSFEIKNEETVTITLYDIIGKQIKTLTDKSYPGGRYLLKYNVTHYPSGSYFLAYQTGNVVKTYKMLIVR